MHDQPLELWHALQCPFSMRARLIFREKGMGFVSRVVTLDDVGDTVRLYNPKGQVPVLLAEGSILYEPDVIAEYLEESVPEPALYPRDPLSRAQCRLWIDWCDTFVVPHVQALESRLRNGAEPKEPTGELEQPHLEHLYTVMDHLADRMPTTDFLMGDQINAADLFFAPFVTTLPMIGVRRDDMPHDVVDWIDRLRDRDCVAAEVEIRERATPRLREPGQQLEQPHA